MVARSSTEDRDLGLVVPNRLGGVTLFTSNDLQILRALARQSAILRHRDRSARDALGRSRFSIDAGSRITTK